LVYHARHWRERALPLITDRESEADSGGSGPLHSAAGAKGEHEGETAPFGFPLGGSRAKPAGDGAGEQPPARERERDGGVAGLWQRRVWPWR